MVLPDGIQPASIYIKDGVIQHVGKFGAACDEDAGDLTVMPGLVDTHVHVNEPGRTHWEGFASVTRAAAAGGITTIIDMPLNSVPAVTSAAALEQKIQSAEGQSWIDVGLWGGVVPGNVSELEPMWNAGGFGFKCFLVPSGVAEFEHVNEADLRQAMRVLARLNAVLLVHAELPEYLIPFAPGERDYSNYLNSRPPASEIAAIKLMLRLCEKTGCRVHIVHLSSAESLRIISDAHASGLPVTVETCPHYLAIVAEDIPDGGTEFKCAPPIREAVNRDALWKGLQDSLIQMIVSDHSPCPAEMKQKELGDFGVAWGGIASLQLSLPVVWTEARLRGFSEADIAEWMALAPARLAGLSTRKGVIAPGNDADLVIWNPDEEFLVDPATFHHRLKLTPYAGRRLYGVVKKTFLHGRAVAADDLPHGRVLFRSADSVHTGKHGRPLLSPEYLSSIS